MKIISKKVPREFSVGVNQNITLRDCGSIDLEPNEQITFHTDDHLEYDVARKVWCYYATPSLNRRLINFGLHAALVRNKEKHYFIVLVDNSRRNEFDTYLIEEHLHLVTWMDSDLSLNQLDDSITGNLSA